jgi:hypothetical protein
LVDFADGWRECSKPTATPTTPLAATHHENDDHSDDDHTQRRPADETDVRRDPPPRFSGEVAGHHNGRRPQRSADEIPQQERAIGHFRHSREARNEGSQGRGKPPDEHCATAEPQDQFLGSDDVFGLDDAVGNLAQQGVAETETDRESDAVADDSTCNGDQDHNAERQFALERKHATEQARDLAGKDEPEKRRRFERRHCEHDK